MHKFVVIEGLDGAGTTTQTHKLVESLRADGHEAIQTCEPTDGPIGAMIRQMLAMRIVAPAGEGFAPINRESLALLFAADRLDHMHSKIVPALENDQFVVSDRYYHSSFAYQGDVDGADHFDIAWVREINQRARRPDVTFFLEASTELCLSRIQRRNASRDIYESREKLARLEKRYDQVMSLLIEEGEKIVRIDASLSIEAIHETIRQYIVTE